MERHERSTHIGSVAVSQGDKVCLALLAKEFSEVICLLPHVGFVEDALGKPFEPTRHAVLSHVSAGADDRCSRQELLTDADEVSLCPSRSVKKQEGSRLGQVGCRFFSELKAHAVTFEKF